MADSDDVKPDDGKPDGDGAPDAGSTSGGTPGPDPQGSKPDTGDTQDLATQLEKWKAMARKHEVRAKEGEAAQKRLQELEDKDKSELERAQQEARQQKDRADKAEARLVRFEVAARKKLDLELSSRLQGDTEEELEADADKLLQVFAAKQQNEPDDDQADKASADRANNGSRNGSADRAPVPKLKPGAVPDAAVVETDPAKVAASIPRSSF